MTSNMHQPSLWRKNTQHKYGLHLHINTIFSPFNSVSHTSSTFHLRWSNHTNDAIVQTLIFKLLNKWLETQLNSTECFKNTYFWVRHYNEKIRSWRRAASEGQWQTMGGPVLKHWRAGRVILEVCDNHAFKFLLW